MVRLILKGKKNLQEAVQPRTYGDVKKAIKQILLKKKGGALGGVLTDQVVGELVKLIPVVGKAKVAYDLVKAIYSATDSVKTNTILDKINVDDDYSKIVDDKLEMAFYEIYLDEQLMNEIANLEDRSLDTLIQKEYRLRDEQFYKKEHKETVTVFHQVFDPLIAWFEEKKKSASTAKASIASAARQQLSQQTTKETASEIEQFWNSIEQYVERTRLSSDESPEEAGDEKTAKSEGLLREVKGAGPEGGQTQFAIKFEDLLSIGIELTKAADDLVISSVQTEKISNANERILKEYLEKYFDYFDKIKKSSDAYFYEDDGNEILTVSSTLLDFHEWVNKTFVTQAGGAIKASSIKEDLNSLTEEARIVMEMGEDPLLHLQEVLEQPIPEVVVGLMEMQV